MECQEKNQIVASAEVVGSLSDQRDKLQNIFIIDVRRYIRDAIAHSVRGLGDWTIFTVENIHSLLTEITRDRSARQLVLYCDGSKDAASVENDLLEIRQHSSAAILVLLTDQAPVEAMSNLVTEIAINGVIPSRYDTRQFMACLKVVESGIRYLPVECAQAKRLMNMSEVQKSVGTADGLLTPRQREIMEYISVGRSNKYIAAELSVSESTVKVHVHEVMKRLGATSRTHASYLMNYCQENIDG